MNRKQRRNIKNPPGQKVNSSLDNMLDVALKHHQEGRIEEATRQYYKILALDPNNFSCYNNLGLIYCNQGRTDEAIKCYQKAQDINPNDPDVYNNFGNLWQSQGQLDNAQKYLEQALRLKPDSSAAHVNLGIVLHNRGRYEQAIAHYQQALRIQPDLGEAYLNLGNSLNKINRWDDAIEAYQQSLIYKPNHSITYNNLGAVLRTQGRLNEAEKILREALRLRPDFMPAYINLGTLLTDIGKTADAVECFEAVLAIKPDRADAISNMLFSLNYMDNISAPALAKRYFEMGAVLEDKFLSIPKQYRNNPNPNRRLRIGYVSPDFRKHAITFYFEPLIRAHDRSQVEIFCYGEIFMPDEMTEKLQQLSDHWRSTVGINDEDLAAQIESDGIDILIDLAGHSAHNRLLTFIRRPAPIQITWLGYPNTTGLKSMNYRFVDAITDPEGIADTLSSEKLIRLESGFHCYQPPDGLPELTPSPCLEIGYVTFGSFNNIAKISPTTIDIWSKLLLRFPNSRIVLKSWIFADHDIRSLIRARFIDRGVPEERINLINSINEVTDHIALYRKIDICLDTFPYNGTTTTCEALWMGVPVITLLGDRHLARVGASLITQVGLQELIARTPEEYIDLAIRLASNPHYLNEIHLGLRKRMAQSSLCDIPRFARKLESTYRTLWKKWCFKDDSEIITITEQKKQIHPNKQLDETEFYTRSIPVLNQNCIDFPLEYFGHVRAADVEIGLRDKRILNIGRGLPEDFLLDEIGVAQWINLQSPKERQNISPTQINLNTITDYRQLPHCGTLSGEIADLPECLSHQFEIVFSLGGFERLLHFGHALEMMAAALIPHGNLYAVFSPIWTAHNGHNLPPITDRLGRVIDFTQPAIMPPWTHLYWRPPQMYRHFLQYTDHFTATEIVYLTYHAPRLNRLFVEDYLDYLASAPFDGQIIKTHLVQLPSEIHDVLRALYPNHQHFDNCGLKMVATRK